MSGDRHSETRASASAAGSETGEADKLSRRKALGNLVAGSGAGYLTGAGLTRDRPIDPGDTAKLFVNATLAEAIAAGEAGVPTGRYFKAVGKAEKLAEVRIRMADGSALLYTEVTTDALAADTGFTLFKYKRPEKGTFARTGAQMAEAGIIDRHLSIMHWVDPEYDRAIRDHTLDTDLSAMVQRGLEHGAQSFPPGRYYFTSGLTLPDYAHLVGQNYQPGAPPGKAKVELRFCISDGVAIQCGFNPTLEYLYLTNCKSAFDDDRDRLTGSSAVCLALVDSASIMRVSFALWPAAILLGSSTYYLQTDMVEFNRCLAGYKVGKAAPYNLHFDKPISRKTRHFFDGNESFPARNIKIFGGSIEGFSSVASNFLDLAVFGTYFETTPPHEGCVAIDATMRGASVALYGNLVYMNHVATFVDMTGAELAMLTGSGNNFDGVGKANASCYNLPLSGTVSLSGDRIGAGHPRSLRYVNSLGLVEQLGGVTFPALPPEHIQASHANRMVLGPRGFVGGANAREPLDRVIGAAVMADGAMWNPLARKSGAPYWVLWTGKQWSSLSGE